MRTAMRASRPFPALARLAAALLATAGAALLTPAARAQDAAPAPGPSAERIAVERLKVERRLLYAEFDRPAPRDMFIEKRLKPTRAEFEKGSRPEFAEVEVLLAECYWSRKEDYAKVPNDDMAASMCAAIGALSGTDGRVKELKKSAEDFLIDVALKKANALVKAGDRGSMEKAKEQFAKLLNTRVKDDSAKQIIRIEIVLTDFDKIHAGGNLTDEGELLDRLLPGLQTTLGSLYDADYPDLKRLKESQANIKKGTQFLELRFFKPDLGAFKGAVAMPFEKATFSLEPVGGEGKRFPDSGVSGSFSASKVRRYRGVYDIRVYSPETGDAPVAVFLAVALQESPASVDVPAAAIPGMVYLGPFKGLGGFFMDRTEVTVGQVKAVNKDANDAALATVLQDSTPDNDAAPAWFATDANARAFEKVTGKRIPTVEQWIQGAFGPTSGKYPWGDDAPDSERVFLDPKADDAKPVGTRAKGGSPFGLQDMAGNVAEWVDRAGQLWLLGGWYKLDAGRLTSLEGNSPLRDPMPSKTVFSKMVSADQNKYLKYQLNTEDTVSSAGLRMVVPVAPAR
jgi:hypothetical protein